MEVTLIDSLRAGSLSERAAAALAASTSTLRVHRLREERFAPCQGCFGCWVKTPGECKARDGANGLMADVMASSAHLWLVRLQNGCYDPVAKVALDKSIGLLSLFFQQIDGETHHRKRYESYPRMAVLAVCPPSTTDDERELFRRIVARNAMNFHAGAPWVGFVDDDVHDDDLNAILADAVSACAAEARSDRTFRVGKPVLPAACVGVARRETPRRVLTWVGSAKPSGTSSSEAVGQALADRLQARGWESETVHSAAALRLGRDEAPALVEAVRRADLVVLAAPIYVDCLPSLVLHGLEALVRAAPSFSPPGPVFLPVLQCGFPEVEHTTLGFDVVRTALSRAGLRQAGLLAMGGGGLLQSAPLDRPQGPAHEQVHALDQAADELEAGGPLSHETVERFARPALSPGLYRLLGQVGWVLRSREHHALRRLWAKPFEVRDNDDHDDDPSAEPTFP